METPFTLALPRLHPELCTLPDGCLTLWPGLPCPPKHTWHPDYPWSPELAAACLEDFRRTSRDGASGAPVLTTGAEPLPADLTPAERDALRELTGAPAENTSLEPRLQAQQMLLLTWLQESQSLELVSLEQRVREHRRDLSALLSGHSRDEAPVSAPDDSDLPDWTRPLAAALTFLPDMPSPTAFFIVSPAMADALRPLGIATPSSFPGHDALCVPARDLAALCGRTSKAQLERAVPDKELGRILTLILSHI